MEGFRTDEWPQTPLRHLSHHRYAGIDPDTGTYVQRVKGVANIDMIGQRLYTGRIVIAGVEGSA